VAKLSSTGRKIGTIAGDLTNRGNWDTFLAARKVLRPGLSQATPALRYSSTAAH
jgi:hypothetical protein